MKSSQLLQAIFFVASRQKRETQTDIDLGDTGQAARAALQSPTKRARAPPRYRFRRHPMARPPAPHPDERARMNVLLGLDVLDTTPEEHFDGLVNLGKCASSSSPNSN